jgi:hypothetical protein
MKTTHIGFVVGLGLLASCALADETVAPSRAAVPASNGVTVPSSQELTLSATPQKPLAPPGLLAEGEPLRLPSFNVSAGAGNLVARLDDALRQERDAIPCYLFFKDLGSSLQLQALGAPISPMPAESRAERMQVRIPVVTLAW